MDTRILLCVDADFSPKTQYALRTIGKLVEQASLQGHLLVLHVVPTQQVFSTHPGIYTGQVINSEIPAWQREQAETLLHKARQLLQEQGVSSHLVECMIRVGVPADEIVRVAHEQHIQLIVVGSQGTTARESIRRFFFGSVSRRVLGLASCPVMIVIRPRNTQSVDLVTWYHNSLVHSMEANPQSLQVFTPSQVALQFLPPGRSKPGPKELAAATLALEQFVNKGALCRHYVKGEARYVND